MSLIWYSSGTFSDKKNIFDKQSPASFKLLQIKNSRTNFITGNEKKCTLRLNHFKYTRTLNPQSSDKSEDSFLTKSQMILLFIFVNTF